jgi:lysophospholipase L1-like esterase
MREILMNKKRITWFAWMACLCMTLPYVGACSRAGDGSGDTDDTGSQATSGSGNNASTGTTRGNTGATPTTGGNTSATNPGNGTSNANQRFIGRVRNNTQGTEMAWSATTYQAGFSGKSIEVTLVPANPGRQDIYFQAYVDDVAVKERTIVTSTLNTFTFSANSDGDHVLTLVKESEGGNGAAYLKSVKPASGKFVAIPSTFIKKRLIQVVGDSISAGYGNLSSAVQCPSVPNQYSADPNLQSAVNTYGYLTAKNLDAEVEIVAYSGKGLILNRDGTKASTMPQLYGLTNPIDVTSTIANGSSNPNVIVVNLGTNDFAYTGVNQGSNPVSADFQTGYKNFVGTLRTRYPNAWIILMSSPMVSDNYPSTALKQMTTLNSYLQAVVSDLNSAGDMRVSFLASPVNDGDYGCDSHPNLNFHQKMATLLTERIKSLLSW